MCFFGAVAHQSSMQELDPLNPQLDPRISYSGGPKMFFGRTGLLESSPCNVALWSEQFDNAAWTKSAATITANATTAPNGTPTADKFVPDNNPLVNFTLYQAVSVTAGVLTAFSIHVKAAEYSSCSLLALGGTQPTVRFDLVAKTATASNGASGYIVELGGGWFRCVLVYTPSTTGSVQHRFYDRTPGARASDGVSGIYVWGAQLEAGAFASPYIPTAGSQVTRVADVATFNPSAVRFNAGNFSIVAKAFAGAEGQPGDQVVLQLDDGTNSNRLLLYRRLTGDAPTAATRSSAGSPGDRNTSPAAAAGAPYSIAAAFTPDNLRACRDGGAVFQDASAAQPVGINTGRIGKSSLNASFANAPIKPIRFYPASLTDAELQALTA